MNVLVARLSFLLFVLSLGLLPEFACAKTWSQSVANCGVSISRYTWRDAERCRSVPVKIYRPTSHDEPCPVIVFSHGLGGSRDGCGYLGLRWAAGGYVSVHLQHHGSDEAVWHGTIRPKQELRAAFLSQTNRINRPRDVSFVIDRLERLAAKDTPLGRQLDLSRIGVAGHAFGAQTALLIAGQALPGCGGHALKLADPRVKAVLAMSSPVPVGRSSLKRIYGSIRVACMHMTGTEDDSPIGATKARHRRLPFDHTTGADKYLITFRGADHMIYPGHRLKRLRGQSDAAYQRLIRTSSLAFWDAHLKDDPAAQQWLAGSGMRTTLGRYAATELNRLQQPSPNVITAKSE